MSSSLVQDRNNYWIFANVSRRKGWIMKQWLCVQWWVAWHWEAQAVPWSTTDGQENFNHDTRPAVIITTASGDRRHPPWQWWRGTVLSLAPSESSCKHLGRLVCLVYLLFHLQVGLQLFQRLHALLDGGWVVTLCLGELKSMATAVLLLPTGSSPSITIVSTVGYWVLC